MTRIDRYLLFLYSRVLVICFVSVTGLLIVVHIFTNLDEFVRYAKSNQRTMMSVLCDYYGPYTLSIFEQLSGLLAMLALLFAIAWLNKTHEFTALQAAGVTKRRVLRPLLWASGIVIAAAVGVRELAVPQFQDRLDRNPQDLTAEVPRPLRPVFDPRSVAVIQGDHLLPIRTEIVAPNLKIQGGQLASTIGRKLSAAKAIHRPACDEHPAGFLFLSVNEPTNIGHIHSIFHEPKGSPLLLTPRDTEWLEEKSCFLVSDIEYEMLRGGSAWKQFAATFELVKHLRGENVLGGNDIKVKIHQRLLRPVIDWTVLLLGLPVLLTRSEGHMFWVAGACLAIVAGFTGVVMACAAIGGSANILAPGLAVWLPVLLFLPWAWARSGAALDQ